MTKAARKFKVYLRRWMPASVEANPSKPSKGSSEPVAGRFPPFLLLPVAFWPAAPWSAEVALSPAWPLWLAAL